MNVVLFVHQDGEMSGSAISLSNLLKALDRSRFQPHVLMGAEGPARALFTPLACSVHAIQRPGFPTQVPTPPFYHPDNIRSYQELFGLGPMVEYMRQLGPDLVHVNDKTILSAGLAAKHLGVPVVWHFRSAYAGGRSPLRAYVSRRVIRRVADEIISISEDEVEGFDRHLPAQVIYNTVDMAEAERAISARQATRRSLGIADDELAIGMVGLLNETKGAWDFIRAAGLVRRRFPDRKLKFVIVAPIPAPFSTAGWSWRGRLAHRLGLIGGENAGETARRLAKESGIENDVLLTGRRSDVMHVLAGLDIVTVCYRMWAVGRPAFEAMAVGRPVIVNEGHSGRSSVVRDGETGLIVPRANPAALARRLGELMLDPDLRRRLGEGGYRYARQNMDAAKNARKVEAVYDRLLGSKSANKG